MVFNGGLIPITMEDTYTKSKARFYIFYFDANKFVPMHWIYFSEN